MKKILLILLIIVSGTVIVLWFSSTPAPDQNTDLVPDPLVGESRNNDQAPITENNDRPNFVTLDSSAYGLEFMETKLTTGQTIEINNIRNRDTVDPNHRNVFRFGSERNDPDRAYDLIYYDEYDAFEVQLLQPPLGNARSQAEVELMDALDVTAEELCDLRLFIRTSIPPYDGQELGVSFCSPAVSL